MGPSAEPPRTIGATTAVALVVGNMIGSGVFLLPASLAAYAGLSLGGWIISTGGALLLALVFARLARAYPAAGGPYAYTRMAFGDLAGFLVAWGYWISVWSSLAALAVAFVGYLAPFLPGVVTAPAWAAVVAVATIWVLAAVNVAGARAAGGVQVVTTILKLMPLVLVAIGGLTHPDASHFTIAQHGAGDVLRGVTATATLTLWAFLGLECATIPADSIVDPDRTIPRATIVGTVVAAIVYIASSVGVMILVPPATLAHTTAPFADAARAIGGEWAARAVAAGAAISAFGALNGWTLVVGQLPRAVARDGLFPRVFTTISRRDSPTNGILIGAVLATGLVAVNYTRGLVSLFTFIILLSTLATLVPYAFCALAGLVLRRSDGARLAASRGAIAICVLAFAYSLWAIGGAGADVVYWGFLLLLAGLPVYVWVGKRGVAALHESAS